VVATSGMPFVPHHPPMGAPLQGVTLQKVSARVFCQLPTTTDTTVSKKNPRKSGNPIYLQHHLPIPIVWMVRHHRSVSSHRYHYHTSNVHNWPCHVHGKVSLCFHRFCYHHHHHPRPIRPVKTTIIILIIMILQPKWHFICPVVNPLVFVLMPQWVVLLRI
jgi:hypothetical protein